LVDASDNQPHCLCFEPYPFLLLVVEWAIQA
jgi:hypothetical protein